MGRMHDYGMFDWGYETDPEPNLNNRRIEAMRGKVLGGSSSINVMAYTRGNRGDYDRWAQKGARGWSYADVLPYFQRCETFENGENTWRGGSGPLGTEFARDAGPALRSLARSRQGLRLSADARITTASSRKDSAAASSPFATAGARHRPTRFSNPRATGKISPSPSTRTPRASRSTARAPPVSSTCRMARPCAPKPRAKSSSPPAPSTRRKFSCSRASGRPSICGQFGINVVADLPVGKNLQDHLGAYMTYTRPAAGHVPPRDAVRPHGGEHGARVSVRHRAGHRGAGRPARLHQDAAGIVGARRRVHVSRHVGEPASVVPAGAAAVPRRFRHPPDAAASRQPRRIVARLSRSARARRASSIASSPRRTICRPCARDSSWRARSRSTKRWTPIAAKRSARG